MPKYIFRKIALIIVCGALGFVTYGAYHGYQESTAFSTFELVASRLGFNGYKRPNLIASTAMHQEAFLKQLNIAGYLKPENLWSDIYRLDIKNPELAFQQIYSAIKKSGAGQANPNDFNAKILRKNLGKGTDLDEQDITDLLFYIGQHAFGRKAGQERNELTAQDWMNKYKDEYFASARILGLIDREAPESHDYDGAWIAGASRVGILARIIDYKYMLNKYDLKINGETGVLAGMRELWANIDGISPVILRRLVEASQTDQNLDDVNISLSVGEDKERIEEGTEYMAGLAVRSGIKLDPELPFIQCLTLENCPAGRFPGRVYPNYASQEIRKLTESLMSQDLLTTYLSDHSIHIVDTLADQHLRPTTSSTARDAAEKLVKDIIGGKYGDKREFKILLVTNNPYIERQTIVTQREVDKVLKDYNLDIKILINGVGFRCKQDVSVVHSEFAALIAEEWKTILPHKRPIEVLQYQTRDNNISVPPMPTIVSRQTSMLQSIIQLWQDLFDRCLL